MQPDEEKLEPLTTDIATIVREMFSPLNVLLSAGAGLLVFSIFGNALLGLAAFFVAVIACDWDNLRS